MMGERVLNTAQQRCIAAISSPSQALERIQGVTLQFLKILFSPGGIVQDMSLVSRTSRNTHFQQSLFGTNDAIYLSDSTHVLSFMKAKSTMAFIRVWKIMEISYQLLQQGKQATQREIFYRLLSDSSDYFNSQLQVNRAIRDVVALLKCSRQSIGILASSRGSLVGRIIIKKPDGEVIDCTKVGSCGQVINGDLQYLQSWKFSSDARYILLVEKDAIFQRLAEDRFFQSIPCIILTAKGYPDLASRFLLYRLRNAYPLLPIVAMVDWNPAGLAIICTFKYGSIGMGLEAPNYVCHVKWLGLRREDLQLVAPEALVPLTLKDKQLAQSLLASKMLKINEEYKQELLYMLQFGYRAELEATYAHGYDFLGKLIAQKIVQRDYI